MLWWRVRQLREVSFLSTLAWLPANQDPARELIVPPVRLASSLFHVHRHCLCAGIRELPPQPADLKAGQGLCWQGGEAGW